MGGGSSDAANIIKFFLSELNVNINDELIESFSSFGADIPFFIRGGCAWVSGIGEKIKNYDFILPYNIILIYPNIHVSTKLAYSKFTYDDFNKSDLFYIKNMLDNKNINFEKIVSKTYNVFENNVFNLEKRIKEIKNKAKHIIKRNVTMSGSGSSLFALYKNDDTVIEEDFKKLKNRT
ncbi:4-diphosphocytidyl-2-C-methyl-D-erythritol kinase [Brachyspira hampsonii 30599]|nr:4-diphosphocytidyl-2-C-methyl-D-erythritol kinase [Brachyspira hampsonii 30599]